MVGTAIGVVIVRRTHGWLNTKGMELVMSNVENVGMTPNAWNDGIHMPSSWGMLSEHTLERCQNCGGWKHEPLPCATCMIYEIRQKYVA